jgi:hypothetical protein
MGMPDAVGQRGKFKGFLAGRAAIDTRAASHRNQPKQNHRLRWRPVA